MSEILSSAQRALSSATTADERMEAQHVIDLVQELQKPTGSYEVSENSVTFRTPRNFTGGSQYYRLTIAAKESSEAAIVIDLAVNNEEDLLGDAMNRLSTAQTNARLAATAAGSAASSTGIGGDDG